MKRKKMQVSADAAGSVLKSTAFGVCSGVIIWTVLLFAVSYAISGTEEPENFIMPAVFCLAGVSALASGFISAKLSGAKSVFSGALSGAVLLLIVWGISLAADGSGQGGSAAVKAVLAFDFVFLACVGAVLARKKPASKRSRRR